MSMNTETVSVRRTSTAKMVVAAVSGNVLEWFDYALYAFFATAISANFFPNNDPIVALLLSFLVFGLGFCARPIGGFIFGHLGDKIGRKNAMSITIITMGTATFLIGVLPTYAQIGIAAPLILTIVRLLQGIAVGGEWGNVISFMGEYSKSNRRAFVVSFTQVGTAGGLLLGSLFGLFLSSIFAKEDLMGWAWRIAFCFGIIVAFFGLYMRRALDETPAFKKNAEEEKLAKQPLLEVFRNYKKEVFTVFMCVSGAHVGYWIIMSYMSTYVNTFLKLPVKMGFALSTTIIIAYMIIVPFMAMAADKFGRKPLQLLGTGGICLFTYPLFTVMKRADSFFEMAVVCVIFVAFLCMFQGCSSIAMSETLPTKVRVSGFSIGFQLSAAVFASTALPGATWLLKVTGDVMAVPIYVSIAMAIPFLSLIFLYKETKDKPYDE